MNRRNFFQTLLAGTAAFFLPKSKKAKYIIGVDKAVEGGDETVFVWDSPYESAYYAGPDIGWINTNPRLVIKENNDAQRNEST